MTLCAKDLFFLGHRCLIIKNITETAVINIVSFLIFIALTQVRVLFDTFLKMLNSIGNVKCIRMRKLTMFITAVCVLFLIKL